MPTYTKNYLSKPVSKTVAFIDVKNKSDVKKDLLLPESELETAVKIKTKSKKSITQVVPDDFAHLHIHKINQRISKLEKTFKITAYVVLVVLLSLVILNLISIFLKPQNSNQSLEIVNTGQNPTGSPDQKSKILNQASVYIFENNPAIFDFGFKIDLKADYIANLNDPNCQTPIVPPTVNGCGFALDLQKIGLPKSGVYYRYVTLMTDTTASSQKIQIDLKDYERGQIVQNIGTTGVEPNSKKIELPPTIPTSQSLYFRFWAPQNVTKIKKITIDYLSIEDLKTVELNLETPFKVKQTGVIYLDADGDGKFTQNKDKRWECTPTFPGVLPLDLKDKTSIKLIREDGCITEEKPENWKNDAGSNSLPAGKWLLVVDPQTVASFEIKPGDTKPSANIKF